MSEVKSCPMCKALAACAYADSRLVYWADRAHEAESERDTARAERDAWREAAGGKPFGFGPQTPEEVPVFKREADRVDGQCAALKIAALQAKVERAVALLEPQEKSYSAAGVLARQTLEALK